MNTRVVVAGGYGVFGSLLVREILRTTDAHVVVAGRDAKRAEESVRLLGPRASAAALDVSDLEATAALASTATAVACAAGPFHTLPGDLPRVVADAGASWLDIADQPSWVLGILRDRGLDATARERGVSVASGLSSVPAISGALARLCAARLPGASRARITLFVGNRNRKGVAAVASALAGGFRDPVPVPTPLGAFRAYRFPSPDEELLRDELGIDAEFRAALELGVSGRVAAVLGRALRSASDETAAAAARAAAALAIPAGIAGRREGLVQVEMWDPDGRSVACVAAGSGQRLAVAPCAAAVSALIDGRLSPGVVHPATWLPADVWISTLAMFGVQVRGRG